ncbi:D-2-hydroxyacid dehydrogenase [candidate division KSB1 bacterium]|nr:D-2-hydroxyacid dehydrogenase [candidate division KSB1 bacterium]
MRLVVLDGYTMNPGDLSWQPLMDLGECLIYERTTDEQLHERCRTADILVTNKVVLSEERITRLPSLKYIGVSATGYNVVDVSAARRAGIIVTHVPAYSTMSVAQMVFAHILNLTMPVARHADSVRSGAWSRCQDFTFWETPLVELDGLMLGIIGLGRIGRVVATVGHSLGMRVSFCDDQSVTDKPAWTQQVDVDMLFAISDILTLHCPLTESSARIVSRERLAMMKKSAFIINTGRGGLVDEVALADALNAGQIAGAGLDVLSAEPPAPDNPLLTAVHCAITPHHAWATGAARQRLMDVVVANVKAYLQGSPINLVEE